MLYRSAMEVNNTNLRLEQTASYDQPVCQHSFHAGEGVSPRFFTNFITSFLMRSLHMPWEGVTLLFVYLCVVVTGVSVVQIVLRLAKQNHAVYTALLSLFIAIGITSGFPSWSTFEPDTVGMGTGFAFSLLALSCVMGQPKRWNTAWLVQTIALLLHVHEGIWGFAMLALLWVLQCIRQKKIQWGTLKSLAVFWLVAAACILPSLKADPSTLTDAQFANIYAFQRAPHHLWPSFWGIKEILRYFLLLVFPGLLRLQALWTRPKERTDFIWELSLCLLSWCCVVVFTYIFTEVWPIASIITLYMPKFLRYISLIAIFWYLQIILDNADRGHWEIALMVAMLGLGAKASGIWVSLILFATVLLTIRQAGVWKPKTVRLFCILLSLASLYWVLGSVTLKTLVLLSLIALLPLVSLWRTKVVLPKKLVTAVYALLTFGIVLFGAHGVVYATADNALTLRTGHDFLVASSTQELYDLATDFQAATTSDDVFLAKPTKPDSDWFQLISRRSCYVLWKTVPSTKAGIEAWYQRYEKVQDMSQRSAADIASLMREISVKFVLVTSSQYNEYRQSADFSLFLHSKHYFVFRLTDTEP